MRRTTAPREGVSPDGNWTAAQGPGYSWRVENLRTHAVATFFDVESPAYPPIVWSWSPDSRRLMTRGVDGDLWVRTVATGRMRRLTHYRAMNPAPVPQDAGWSADGRFVAYVYHGLVRITDAGGDPRVLAPSVNDDDTPAWRTC